MKTITCLPVLLVIAMGSVTATFPKHMYYKSPPAYMAYNGKQFGPPPMKATKSMAPKIIYVNAPQSSKGPPPKMGKNGELMSQILGSTMVQNGRLISPTVGSSGMIGSVLSPQTGTFQDPMIPQLVYMIRQLQSTVNMLMSTTALPTNISPGIPTNLGILPQPNSVTGGTSSILSSLLTGSLPIPGTALQQLMGQALQQQMQQQQRAQLLEIFEQIPAGLLGPLANPNRFLQRIIQYAISTGTTLMTGLSMQPGVMAIVQAMQQTLGSALFSPNAQQGNLLQQLVQQLAQALPLAAPQLQQIQLNTLTRYIDIVQLIATQLASQNGATGQIQQLSSLINSFGATGTGLEVVQELLEQAPAQPPGGANGLLGGLTSQLTAGRTPGSGAFGMTNSFGMAGGAAQLLNALQPPQGMQTPLMEPGEAGALGMQPV